MTSLSDLMKAKFGTLFARQRSPSSGLAVGRDLKTPEMDEAPKDPESTYENFRLYYRSIPLIAGSIDTYCSAVFAEPPLFVSGKRIIKTGLAAGATGSEDQDLAGDAETGAKPVPQVPKQNAFPQAATTPTDYRTEEPEDEEPILQWWDQTDLRWKLEQVLRTALVYGDAYGELLKSRDHGDGPWGIDGLKPIAPQYITVITDASNTIEKGFLQRRIGVGREDVRWNMGQMIHFAWDPLGGEIYGTSLIRRLLTTLAYRSKLHRGLYWTYWQFIQPTLYAKPSESNMNIDVTSWNSFINALADQINQKHKLVGLPEAIDVSVIGADREIPDPSAWMNELNGDLASGLLTPVVLLGQGGNATEATAKVQMAAYDWHIRRAQEWIADKVNNQLLPQVVEYLNTKYGGDYSPRTRLVFPKPLSPVFNQPAAQKPGMGPNSTSQTPGAMPRQRPQGQGPAPR